MVDGNITQHKMMKSLAVIMSNEKEIQNSNLEIAKFLQVT